MSDKINSRKELFKIRNYFGEHDKTGFEHWAYSFLDGFIKAMDEESKSPSKPTVSARQSAEEFYETLANKKLFTKLTSTGISGNLEEVFEFAEDFAQQPQPPAPISEETDWNVRLDSPPYLSEKTEKLMHQVDIIQDSPPTITGISDDQIQTLAETKCNPAGFAHPNERVYENIELYTSGMKDMRDKLT